ncbi:hypothetical protein BH09BAC5_BH09BAC5_16410 [soil metagenome]
MKFRIADFFIVFLLIISGNLFSQNQFGVAAKVVALHSIENVTGAVENKALNYGLSGEIMKTKLGIDRFRLSYISLSCSFLVSPKQNAAFHVINSSNTISVPGTFSGNQIDGTINLGFNIPQRWNDFLFLNIGFGTGLNSGKTVYDVPGFENQLSRLSECPDGTAIIKGFGYMTDIFLTTFYELQNFYLFFQLKMNSNVSRFYPEGIAFRTNFGVYYSFHKNQ